MDILLIILIALLVVIAVIVAFIIYLEKKHKWIVEIREVCGNRRIVSINKGLDVTRDGVKYIKVVKADAELPIPPEDVIDVTNKGKKFIVVYNLGGGNYQFCKDSVETEHIKKGEVTFYGKDIAVIGKNYTPLSTNQRLVLIEQIKKAMARRKKTLWDMIPQIAAISACVMVVFALFLFWGDLAKPVLEAGQQNAKITDKLGSITVTLQEILQKKQIIDYEPAQPPDSGGDGS